MRMSRAAKAEHHEEIVAVGSRMLRERGIAGTSVADIMQAAGLTHGGFYRHFKSKEALVAEASEAAHGEFLTRLDSSSEGDEAHAALEAYVSDYLSDIHVANPEIGCPMAALGTEVAREQGPLHQIFAIGTEGLIEKFSAAQTGTPADRRANAVKLFITLVGSVVIARAVGSGELREEILFAGRNASHVD